MEHDIWEYKNKKRKYSIGINNNSIPRKENTIDKFLEKKECISEIKSVIEEWIEKNNL